MKLKATAIERMDQVADEEYHFCPFIRNELYLPDNYMEITREKKQEARNWAINCVFMYRYFYNKEFKLLGVYGVSNCLRDMFDTTVHFQNSCDQNYDRTDWEGVKLFENMYDAWMNYPKEYIRNKYDLRNGDGAWEKAHGNDEGRWLDYYRKDMCYEEIWRLFEHTLYNHEYSMYFAVFGPHDISETSQFVKLCYDKYKEWEKEFEDE